MKARVVTWYKENCLPCLYCLANGNCRVNCYHAGRMFNCFCYCYKDESLCTTPLYISAWGTCLVYFRNIRRWKRSRFRNALLYILFSKLKSTSEFGPSESEEFISWAAPKCRSARKYRTWSCQFWIWIVRVLQNVTCPPGCQMVTDHWFYSRDKAVLWELGETKYLILPESESLELRMETPIVPSSPWFHSFVLLWPANYILWVQGAEMV